MEMCSSLSPVDRFIKGYVSAIWKSNHGAHFFFFLSQSNLSSPSKSRPHSSFKCSDSEAFLPVINDSKPFSALRKTSYTS